VPPARCKSGRYPGLGYPEYYDALEELDEAEEELKLAYVLYLTMGNDDSDISPMYVVLYEDFIPSIDPDYKAGARKK